MTAIVTADIINSRKLPSAYWITGLKDLLATFGKSPSVWEIYRGDEFQLEIKNPEDALLAAFRIKAYLKTIRLDARMSIGIGAKDTLQIKSLKAMDRHLSGRVNFLKP